MRLALALIILFSFSAIKAQKKLHTVELTDTIMYSFVDRPGDLYLLTKSGQVHKYGPDGQLIILSKTEHLPTLFDPRDGARLFAYYRHNQHYEYLTPSFEVDKAFRIDPSFAIQPWLIAPSGDHKLWVLDQADNTLKKINPRLPEVEVEITIDTAIVTNAKEFISMREYQGFLFLHKAGESLHIFNGIGRHIRTIDTKGIRSFHFLGEELYYFQDNVLKFFDLFSAELRETRPPQMGGDILLTDVRLYHVTPRKVDIYEYVP